MTSATIASLWRYPVKSMMGEEINACDLTEKGLLGDRAFGVIDVSSGKLANAKNPLKWPNMFRYRAAFTEPPELSKSIPPVRITFPDGQTMLSTDEKQNEKLTESFHRKVQLATPSSHDIQFEGLYTGGYEITGKSRNDFHAQFPSRNVFRYCHGSHYHDFHH